LVEFNFFGHFFLQLVVGMGQVFLVKIIEYFTLRWELSEG
jgi:hypothetical protein